MPSKKAINVTAEFVTRSILDALADAPTYPHHIVFSEPYYQRRLINRVLSNMCNHYVICRQGDRANYIETLLYCLEEQAAIETLIRESMTKILEESYGWTDSGWTDAVHAPDNVLIIPVVPSVIS